MNEHATHTAIEQLYNEYHQPILRHLERLIGQRETAEDLCQETFVKALRAWDQHDSAASVRAWLYRIATNTAYDYLRRQRRVPMVALNDERAGSAPTAGLDTHVNQEPLWAAMNQIPQHYRVPLILHAWAGYSMQDIATTLGANTATIKTRIYRARMQFRQHYAE